MIELYGGDTMSGTTDRYEPKLYENDQTRYALTPAMQRMLRKDHLCFHEEIIDDIDSRDIQRILSGYLRYRRDLDVYALEDAVTAALDAPRKRGGGAYRLRFGRELTDLICSFDFSREDNFDKRVLVETLLQAYCSLPYAEREKVFFYDNYLTITECINEQTLLEVRVRTVTGEVRTFSYQPCVLHTDDSSLLCYLAGFSREIGAGSKYGIYAVRLQRIVTAINTKQRFTLDAKQREELQSRLDERGIAYVNQEISDSIRVALTEKGYQNYLKITLHQRPLPSAPVEVQDAEFRYILTFRCSYYQIMYYFFSFGPEVMILEPEILRELFAEKYRRAEEVYQDSEQR